MKAELEVELEIFENKQKSAQTRNLLLHNSTF